MIRRVLTIVAATLVAILIAEGAVRFSDQRRERVRREADRRRTESGLPELTSLFQLVQPNQRGINAGVLYESNSLGVRGPERAKTKPSDVFRTVVIGDSFTMGSGVLYEDTYAAGLERTMPEIQGRLHEVINLGMSGYNLEHSLNRYEALGQPFRPDLVVSGFTLNDIEGPSYVSLMECSPEREGHRGSWLHLWRCIGETWRWADEALNQPTGSYPFEVTYNYFDNPNAWGAFDQQLARLAALARRDGVCGVVLIHTQLQALNRFHPYLDIYERVAEAAAQHGLFVAQSFPSFRGESPAALWVAPADSHPNARGHEILLRVLSDGLAQLPNECWQGDRRGGMPGDQPLQ